MHGPKKFAISPNRLQAVKMSVAEILFIRQKYTDFGGAERYLQRLNEVLTQKGYKTKILHSTLPKWLPSWLKALLFSRQICKTKDQTTNDKRQTTEIFFSFDRITCPDIYRAGDGVHKAFLQTKGFSFNPLHLIYPRLEAKAFQNAKIIIANSNMVKNQILSFYPNIDSQKIAVIYNGVPIPEKIDKENAKNALADELHIDPTIPWILFVGSGFERKGVNELLRILTHLNFSFHAFVIGKEKRLARYKAKAERLNLASKVTFTGPRIDVARFYETSDLFLFPTHYEPFSNVVLEALSYGTPAITTRQNGAHEILPSEWVMNNPQDTKIISTIVSLLKNRELHQEAIDRSREIACSLSLEINVEQTLKVIQKVANLL